MVLGHQLVLFLHILAAAVWLGAGLGLSRRVKRGLQVGGAALDGALDDARRARVLSLIGAIATVASGLVMLFLLGGFKAVPVRIHLGLGLSLFALLAEVALVWPAISALLAGRRGPGLVKRVAAGTGVVHLLWALTLASMLMRTGA